MPTWIFSMSALFMNCSSASTRVVLKHRSRSMRPAFNALCRWYMVSSMALSSATRLISWLWTMLVEHTNSSTSGSPFRRNSDKFRSACSTVLRKRDDTFRQTSRTASSRAISSRIAGSPAKRSVCCARSRSASTCNPCDREANSDRILSCTCPWR